MGIEVTGPQYATLVAVAGWPQVDQKRAAELASLDKSTIAGVVARLERKGWVTRCAHPSDARRRLMVLTDHARADLPRLTVAVAAVQRRLLEPLPDEQRDAFVALLQVVAFGSRQQVLTAAPMARTDVLELARTPGYLIRRAQRAHFAMWNEVFAGDLTGPQYAVLAAVVSRRSADQVWIGTWASLDSSSVADIVARLADKGWLTRTRDPADRRRMLIALTPPALTAMRHLTSSANRVQQQLLAGLGVEDAAAFIEMMQRVARIGEADSVSLNAVS